MPSAVSLKRIALALDLKLAGIIKRAKLGTEEDLT